VRQDGDVQFRNLLLRLHQGLVIEEDWEILCQRDDVVNLTASGAKFEKSLHLYPKHSNVFQHNYMQLKKLKIAGQKIAVIEAEHAYGGKIAAEAASDSAGGLEKILALCIGARVMLVYNLWVEQGLVNGSVGTVKNIIFQENSRPPSLPLAVLIQFDNYNGPCLKENVVPITPKTAHWMDKGKSCCRRQLPLTLCWATTIHKSQGLTLDKVKSETLRPCNWVRRYFVEE